MAKLFTANASKTLKGRCQPSLDSICYTLTFHDDHFHQTQIVKLASSTDAE